jgi:hypothetical protein
MDPDVARALNALHAAVEFAKDYRFEMTDDYYTLLGRVEAMPQNRPGSDKSGIWQGLRRYRESFTHARSAPRRP